MEAMVIRQHGGVEQILFRDDAAGPFDQIGEQRERARRQTDLFSVARERCVGEVEAERPKEQRAARGGRMKRDGGRGVLISHRRRARATIIAGP